MVRLLRANGMVEEISPKNGNKFELKELQDYVGGYIELVQVPEDGLIAIANEEGLLKRLPFNSAANIMFGLELVGDIIICPPTMIN